jgi:thiol-disulfide isomerase/thioredoxin
VLAYFLVERYPPSLAVGSLAPLDNKITSLSGAALNLQNKFILINFWATWCAPCEQELPELARLAKKYPRVSFVGVAVDSPPKDILALKTKYKLDYALGQTSAQAIKSWHAELVPTTYIINKSGHIVWARAGLAKEQELEQALASLQL